MTLLQRQKTISPEIEPRAEAVIDLSAIASNVKLIQETSGVPVMAVVKADAYGHGLLPVAKAAIAAGAEWLGTGVLSEALALRRGGVDDCRILAWITPPNDDFAAAIASDIDLSVSSVSQLKEIAASGKTIGKLPRVHLEVDSGMTRGGVLGELDALIGALKEAIGSREVELVGTWSHFACADEPNHDSLDRQESVFRAAIKKVQNAGLIPGICHLANSAAALARPSSRFNLVRAGIAMYGLSPFAPSIKNEIACQLKPAMTLRAKLFLVKDVPGGTRVGYGCAGVTTQATKIGMVPLGYADGIPRNSDATAWVQVGNRRAHLIGRVSMDQFAVDLGPDSPAEAGDWVTVFGSGESCPTAQDWASANRTIHYEIITRLSNRVHRSYREATQ